MGKSGRRLRCAEDGMVKFLSDDKAKRKREVKCGRRDEVPWGSFSALLPFRAESASFSIAMPRKGEETTPFGPLKGR